MDLFQEDWKELQVGLPQKVEGHPLLGLLGVPNRYGKVHYRYVFDLGCDYAVYWASTVGDPNYLAQFEGLLASDTKPLIQKMFGHIPTTYVGRSYWDFPNQLHWLCRSNFRWERVGPNKELRGPLLGLWDVFKQCYQFVFDLDCDYLVEVCSAIIVDPLNYLADFEGKLASETEPLIQQMFDPQTQSVYHTDYLAWFLGIVGNHPCSPMEGSMSHFQAVHRKGAKHDGNGQDGRLASTIERSSAEKP